MLEKKFLDTFGLAYDSYVLDKTTTDSQPKYPGQECQDENVNKAFRKLHEKLVDDIIIFCKAWNIQIDNVSMFINHINRSTKHGEWQPCTDSSLVFYQENKDSLENKTYLLSV